MRRLKTQRVTFIAILVFVLAATVTLAVLQYRWSAAVAQREGSRMRANLALQAQSIVDGVNHEVWYALDLLREAVRDPDFDEDTLRAVLDEWERNARYPRLISEVIAVRRDEGGGALRWAGGSIEELSTADVRTITEPGAGTDLVDDFTLVTRGPGENPNGIGLARIDRAVLFSTIFPDLAEDTGIGLILRGPNEEVLFRLGEVTGREPDARVPVRILPFSPPFIPNPDNPAEPSSDVTSFSAVTERYLSDTVVDETRSRDQWQRYSLEAYQPVSSVDRFVSRQRRSNLIVSWGVLAVELAALAVAFELYRRTSRLRRREQEFVALMSHELRTPLSLITTAADNLRSGYVVKPERVGEYAEMIGRHAGRLNTMVDNILTYARMSAGRDASDGNPAREASTMRPVALVQHIAADLGPTAAASGVRIDVVIDHDPGKLCLDEEGLRTVLSNLIRNALIHGSTDRESNSESDGRVVRVKVSSASPESFLVAVRDRGPGIPAREQKRIFDPFVRGSRSVERQVRGSGLGLYLVRTIVAAMGGTVQLDSPPAGETPGTEVTVTLPLVRCDGGAA